MYKAEEAIKNGAGEIDYVINIGKIKEGNIDYIKEEMETQSTIVYCFDMVTSDIVVNTSHELPATLAEIEL